MKSVIGSEKTASVAYLVKEAVLILLLSYFTLVATAYKGVIVFETRLLTHILVAVILIIWLGHKVFASQDLPSTSLDFPILSLLFVHVLVTFLSYIPRLSLEGLQWTVTYIMLFYLVTDLPRRGWPVSLFVKSLLVVGGIACLLAGLEALGWYSSWFAIGGLAHPVPPSSFRLTKTLGWSNLLAAYLNLVIPLAIMAAVGTSRRFTRLLLIGWLLLALAIQLLTSSRGGWLGLLAAISTLVVVLIFQHLSRAWLVKVAQGIARRKVLAGVVIAGVLIASLPLVRIGYRLLQHPTHGGSEIAHLAYWRSAWSAFLSRPVTGTGLWTYGTQFLRYGGDVPLPPVEKAHNLVLMVLAESGILGLAASALLLGTVIIAAKRRWATAGESQRLLITACIAGLAGFLAHGLVDDFLTFPLIIMNMVIIVALALSDPVPRAVRFRRRRSARWLMGPVLIFLGVMFWTDGGYFCFSKGGVLATKGEWATGATFMGRAVSLDPAFPFYRFQLGLAYGQLAHQDGSPYLERAIEQYERGLSQESDYALNHANLAALYWQSGQAGKAIQSIQQAMELAPKMASYAIQQGSYYEQLGSDTEATRLYGIALGLDPSLIAELFWEESELRREFVADQRSIVENAPPSSYVERGQVAYHEGHYEDAIALFESVVAVEPANSSAHVGLGLAYLAEGNEKAAIYNLRVAEFLGDRREPHLALGRLAYEQGDLSRAIAEFESGLMQSLYSDGYGPSVYRREGIYQSRLPQLPQLRLTQNLVDHYLQLAAMYEEANATARAREVYLMLIEYDPNPEEALEGLARLEERP